MRSPFNDSYGCIPFSISFRNQQPKTQTKTSAIAAKIKPQKIQAGMYIFSPISTKHFTIMPQLSEFAKVRILIYHFSLTLAVDILNQSTNNSRDWINFLAKAASEVCTTFSPEEIDEQVSRILNEPKKQ